MIGILNFAVYSLGILGSLLAGILAYDGLLSREEKRRSVLMAKRRLKAFQEHTRQSAIPKHLDELLKKAGNPLGLTAVRYQMFRYGIAVALFIYYFVIPFILHKDASFGVLAFVVVFLYASSPKFPYTLFSFVIKKLVEIQESKKNNEVFQLHDLLISELQLMESRQVNTYHLLKRLYKYFDYIQPELQELIQPHNWKDDPTPALERFAERIGTPEANMLVNILSKFDKHTNRDVAIASLESNSKLFSTKQIENYRTRRKLVNDLATIPIFITHILIVFNFIAIVVIITLETMKDSTL